MKAPRKIVCLESYWNEQTFHHFSVKAFLDGDAGYRNLVYFGACNVFRGARGPRLRAGSCRLDGEPGVRSALSSSLLYRPVAVEESPSDFSIGAS